MACRGADGGRRRRPGACSCTTGVYKSKAGRYSTQEGTFRGEGRFRPSPAIQAGSRGNCSRRGSYEACQRSRGINISTESSTSPRRHQHLHGGIDISTEASTSPRRHAGMPAATGEKPMVPQGTVPRLSGKRYKRLTRVVGKTNCPAGTEVFRVQGTRWACKQRGRPSQPSHPTDRTGARHVTGKDVHAARKRRLTTSGLSASASAAQKRSRWNKRLQGREP
jgi:hypothetical protein